MKKIEIGVVLTVLNESESIHSTIKNLLEQTREPDEIVIVDGGSEDGTIEKILEFTEANQNLKLVVEKGVNISQGRNIAISHTSCQVIAATDSGCRPERNWLEKMVEPLLNNPKIDVVKGIVRPEPFNLFEKIGGVFLAGHLDRYSADMYPLSGRASLFKKEIWERSGGYPEWLYTGEDTLFHRKLKSMRANIHLAEEALVYWRPRKTFRKMMKMCFLYGRGNGRIGDDISGAVYHLRNYFILILLCAFTSFFPWCSTFAMLFAGYLYVVHIRPVVKKIKNKIKDPRVELLSPVIVLLRNFSSCLGMLAGHLEYKYKDPFKKNLHKYMET